MALFRKLAALAVTLASITTLACARELPHVEATTAVKAASLQARLTEGLWMGTGEGNTMVDCWNALLELKSCTNEIVLFFLNGESYLGLDCCRAIRIITHRCWPSMLTSLSFTVEEGDILRGYCDAETSGDHVPAPPQIPATPPAVSSAN